MHTKSTAVVIGATAGILWVAVSSGQDVRPTPGAGTGVVTVAGTVDVGSMPPVKVVQGSEWKVAVVSPADVRVIATPPLEFLKPGRRYSITWSAGQTETVVVRQLGSGGWVRVEPPNGRARWLNLDAARAVEDVAQ